MIISKTEVDFTDLIEVGRFAFFVYLDRSGINFDNNDLVSQAIHFPRVVFKGYEPFLQKTDLAKVLKDINKKNSKTQLEIHTKAMVKPTGITTVKNIIFNVELLLKNSDVPYENRIIPNVIKWFIDAGSNFIFKVLNQDDIDELELIINDHGISKQNVFLAPKDGTEDYYELMSLIIKQCKRRGYNFTASVDYNILQEVESN